MTSSEYRPRSVTGIVLTRIIGLIFFLIVLAALNMLIPILDNRIYQDLIGFLNNNVWLVILFSFLFLFGEVFSVLSFPLSLPAPLMNALGAVFLVSFFFRFLYRIDRITNSTNFSILEPIAPLVYLIIFLLVLIIGYVELFSRVTSRERAKEKQISLGTENTMSSREVSPGDDVSWERIGSEFRQLLYDILHALRMALRGNQ